MGGRWVSRGIESSVGFGITRATRLEEETRKHWIGGGGRGGEYYGRNKKKIFARFHFFLESPITRKLFCTLCKTVQIETHSSLLFGGTFFYNRPNLIFFRASVRKTKNKYLLHQRRRCDGRQRLWLFLLPVGHPRPLRSRARIDRAMGDAPYRWRHENRAGVDVLPNNPPWRLFRKTSNSGRRQGHERRNLPPVP